LLLSNTWLYQHMPVAAAAACCCCVRMSLSAELLRYGRMGMPVDVYAFGITMWELYTGQVRVQTLLHIALTLYAIYTSA
jgi:hypothetical protein